MKGLTSFIALVATVSLPVLAGELDPTLADAPQGLVVRVSADGKHEVFKANLKSGVVESDSAALEVINSITTESKVESMQPMSELDRVTSDESWHFSWGRSRGCYSYGYRHYGSYYSYYPSYSYSFGSYRYNYYYTPSYYGYRSCHSSFYDSYGYHYNYRYGWY